MPRKNKRVIKIENGKWKVENCLKRFSSCYTFNIERTCPKNCRVQFFAPLTIFHFQFSIFNFPLP